MTRGLKIRLVAMAIAALACLWTARAGNASYAITTAEWQFYGFTGGGRITCQSRAISLRSDLSYYAHQHSLQMASRGYIYHSSDKQLYAFMGSYRTIGENVGMGGSLYSLQSAFWHSSAHKSNICYSAFSQVGTGVVYSGGHYFVTVIFRG